MPVVPIVLLLALYVAPIALFWPVLSRLAIIAVLAALIVSLITHLWVDSVFQSDDLNEMCSARKVLSDMRFSMAAALVTPSPYLAGALAAIWLSEGHPQLGLASLLVAGILVIVQLRISVLPERKRQTEQQQKNAKHAHSEL